MRGNDMTKWAFRNYKTSETILVGAIDGGTAWKIFSTLKGEQKWHGGFEMPLYNPWDILCVCTCGKTQVTKFCSEKCYAESEGSV